MEDLKAKLTGVMNGQLSGEDIGLRSMDISPITHLKVEIDKQNLKAEQFQLSQSHSCRFSAVTNSQRHSKAIM